MDLYYIFLIGLNVLGFSFALQLQIPDFLCD